MTADTETSLSFAEWCIRGGALVLLSKSPAEAYSRLLADRERGHEPPARIIAVLRSYLMNQADRESILARLILLAEVSRQDRSLDPEKPSCVEGLDLML